MIYIKNNGLTSVQNYSYTGKDGKCKTSYQTAGKVSSVYAIQNLNGNENRLKSIVANYGPVAVAINAADSFMNYMSGVYNNQRCSKRPDHAVLLVGYGTDKTTGLDYWLVKNSWSVSWGESGYVRMARNKGNQCGIANSVVYAT
jgi:C1A family cysteine protease